MIRNDVVEKIVSELKSKYSSFGGLPKQVQIHFAGTQRTGKTIIALVVTKVLESIGFNPVLVDIDETRTTVFAENEPRIGSPLQHLMHSWTYRVIFNFRIPDILKCNGTPVVAATHSHPENYQEAKRVSEGFGSALKFIILESPSIEEVARRCQNTSESDKSDMRDIIDDPNQRRVYEGTQRRFEKTYKELNGSYLRIPQGSIAEMAQKALDFILQGLK